MAGGETIGRATVERVGLGGVILDALLRLVCSRLGHDWKPFGTLVFGKRSYCTRCSSNMVELPDGATFMATGVEVRQGEPRFAEALYEARWGDPPRRKMVRGEWPAP